MKLRRSQLCCFLLVAFVVSSTTANEVLKTLKDIKTQMAQHAGTTSIDVTLETNVEFLDKMAAHLNKARTPTTTKLPETEDEWNKVYTVEGEDVTTFTAILEEAKAVMTQLTGLADTPAEVAYGIVRDALRVVETEHKYTLKTIQVMEDAVKVEAAEPKTNTWLGLVIRRPEVLLEVSETTTAAATVKLNSKRQRIQRRMQRQALTRMSHKSSTRLCEWCARMWSALVDAISRYFSSAKFHLVRDARFYGALPFELPPFHSAVEINNEVHRVLWDTGAEHLYLTDANFVADNGEGGFLFGAKRAADGNQISHVELNAVLMPVPAANSKILWDNDPVKQMDAFLSYRTNAQPSDITVNYGVSGALGRLTLDTLGRHRCIRFHRNGDNGYIHWGTKCPNNDHFVHVPTAGIAGIMTFFTLKGRANGLNAEVITLTIQPNGAGPITIQNGGTPARFADNGGNGDPAHSAVKRLILDTGAGPMLGPRQTVHRLHQIICNAAANNVNCMAGYTTGYDNNNNPLDALPHNDDAGLPSWADFSVACDDLGDNFANLPIVRFGIDVGGATQEYVLTGNDYVIRYGDTRCVIGFLPLPDHAHANGFENLFGPPDARDAWLMGDTFFRNRDTYFRIDANGDYSTHLRLAA